MTTDAENRARVKRARAAIRQRKALAEEATSGPWERPAANVFRVVAPDAADHVTGRPVVVTDLLLLGRDDNRMALDAAFIALNDPTHVLAVLKIAAGILRRHRGERHYGYLACTGCGLDSGEEPFEWPCAEIKPVLDLYAPERP